MRSLRRIAVAAVLLLYLAAGFAGVLAPVSYEVQDREHLNVPPGPQFLLGTDELGRDRLARLLFGMQTSLLLAPAAALLSTSLAAAAGIICGYAGGRWNRGFLFAVDLVVSTPWLFLLLTARALLPLNVGPWVSVGVTFALLGLLGWASGVRVILAATERVIGADFLLQARAAGYSRWRLLRRSVLPNVQPVILAQFWTTVPLFVLAEANLSMLGLGVSEPRPSLGNLLTELRNYAAVYEQPWLLAPALLLVAATAALQLLLPEERLR